MRRPHRIQDLPVRVLGAAVLGHPNRHLLADRRDRRGQNHDRAALARRQAVPMLDTGREIGGQDSDRDLARALVKPRVVRQLAGLMAMSDTVFQADRVARDPVDERCKARDIGENAFQDVQRRMALHGDTT